MKDHNAVEIGRISACIDGAARYTTVIDVRYNSKDGTVEVRRLENGACGGMDGDGRSDPFAERQRVTVTEPTGAKIVKAIKMVMDVTTKRYGKPTKNFEWELGQGTQPIKGLNAKNAQIALNEARDLLVVLAQGNIS
jgi:hypothetical protein